MWATNPPRNKTKVTDLHLTTIKIFIRYKVWKKKKKKHKKWTAMYWFAHKAYMAAMKGESGNARQLEWASKYWWLSGWQIHLVAIHDMFPPFPHRFPYDLPIFPQFLWVFPMFPLLFLPVFYFRSYECVWPTLYIFILYQSSFFLSWVLLTLKFHNLIV